MVIKGDATAVIEKAKAMVAAGEVDAARTLLLKQGYIESLDAGIQAAYLELIPVNPRLQACLETQIAKLGSPDSSERLAAARQLAKDALKETSDARLEALGDPRVTGALLGALQDEDDRVGEQAVIALAEIARRYFSDRRAVDGFRNQLSSERELARFWAVQGLGFMLRQEAAPELFQSVSDRGAKVRAEGLRQLSSLMIDNLLDKEANRHVLELSSAALDDKAEEVRIAAANLLGRFGTSQHVILLQQRMKKEKSQSVKRRLKAAIERFRERHS